MKTISGLTSPRQKIKTGNHHPKEEHLGVVKPFEMKKKKEKITMWEFENRNRLSVSVLLLIRLP